MVWRQDTSKAETNDIDTGLSTFGTLRLFVWNHDYYPIPESEYLSLAVAAIFLHWQLFCPVINRRKSNREFSPEAGPKIKSEPIAVSISQAA